MWDSETTSIMEREWKERRVEREEKGLRERRKVLVGQSYSPLLMKPMHIASVITQISFLIRYVELEGA